MPEPTRAVLRALAGAYGLVGCITGRRALDARRIVGVEEIAYMGNHGFESLHPGSDEPTPDAAVGGRSERPRLFVESLDQDRLATAGLRIEDKGAIQALHWRGAATEGAAMTQAKEVATLAQAAGLVPRWGRKVLEIRPIAGIDKGAATMRMVREAGSQTAMFGGDDETDLDAFQALRWMASSDRLQRGGLRGRRLRRAARGARRALRRGRRRHRGLSPVAGEPGLAPHAVLRSTAIDRAAGRRRCDGPREP